MSAISFFNIKKAIQRLVWRLGNGKFEPNQSDANALQFIIDWINKDKSQLLDDNSLVAKCYVKLLMYELIIFKDVNEASKNVNQQLIEYPIQYFYDEFANSLNQLEYEKYMKSKGSTCKHAPTLTDKEILIDKKIIKENTEEFKTMVFDGKWTKNKVYESLNNQITELLKKDINS